MIRARRLCKALLIAPLLVSSILASANGAGPVEPLTADEAASEAKRLTNLRQITKGFPRAGEGYFSPDGTQIVFQAFPIGYPFYQIYVQSIGGNDPRLLSTGRGRTTCAYFAPDSSKILFASAHTDPQLDLTEKAAREEAAKGGKRRYQWDFDPHMDLYLINPDGTGLQRLTDTPGYDAEGSFSSDGKHIVFTSSRDGDADLYIMDANGDNVRQLTNQPGYDGGPFFSPDGRWVIFRSDRHKEHMLQLYAISVDGKHEFQLTQNLDEVNWCPYFHPTSNKLIWSRADYSQGPMKAYFKLFAADFASTDETFLMGEPRQVTFGKSADVLPVFSPDGKTLMFTSTRTPDGTSQLWAADWNE